MRRLLFIIVLLSQGFLYAASDEPHIRAIFLKNDRELVDPLLEAVRQRNINKVKIAFAMDPRAINYQYRCGATVLHIAAQNGDTDIVEFLLESGASPDIQTFDCDMTPLHLAAQNGHGECIKILLNWKADPKLLTTQGFSAYQLAKHFQHNEAAEILFPQ